MERSSFVFYRSFYEAIKDLPRDVQGEVYTAIMEYGLNGTTTERLKPIARSIFTLIKPLIDNNNVKYENGKKGGRPSTEGKPKQNQTITEPKPNDNPERTEPKPYEDVDDNEDVNDNDKKDKGETAKRFTPPSQTDLSNFISENHYCVDTETFYNFYEAKGWMVGKNKMKDWKAAVRTWNQKEKRNVPDSRADYRKVVPQNAGDYTSTL